MDEGFTETLTPAEQVKRHNSRPNIKMNKTTRTPQLRSTSFGLQLLPERSTASSLIGRCL